MSAFPESVRIREVGPRDGFQNEPETLATEDKIKLIDALAQTGLKRIEVASFVRADVIPQLADGADVLRGVDVGDDVDLCVLIPNQKGLDAALDVADTFDDIALFLSASETHNQKNINRPVDDSLKTLEGLIPQVLDAGKHCGAVIATAFGCPYEGHVDPDRVIEIGKALADAGLQELGFGDTTGMANPRQVEDFFTRAREELGGELELTAHFHNTRGQGLANVTAALRAGVTSFESSFGELGGCPVPPGSTGNIASEDLISMLHEMDVATGVDLAKLIEASRMVQDILGRTLTSHTIVAGPVEWDGALQA